MKENSTTFYENLKNLCSQKDPFSQEAWSLFSKREFPELRHVKLSELYKSNFSLPLNASAPSNYPTFCETHLVFANGSFAPNLSQIQESTVALPLSSAYKKYGSYLKGRISKQMEEEKDPFALLNGAIGQEGLFLFLPPNSHHKIQIVHLANSCSSRTLLSPRVYLFAGKRAEAEIYLINKIEGSQLWINSFSDFALDEEARVLISDFSEKKNEGWNFNAVRVTQKKQSLFKHCALTNGAETSRVDYKLKLLEAGAEASLYGVWKLEEKKQHHVQVLMEHHEENCTSLQSFKGVLNDKAKSSFAGKIYVYPKAQKTNAYQRNHNLLLSKAASAFTKPMLEIFADDVKASHGATVGQLDEEALFYLKSRGIAYKDARQLLVDGFIQDIFEHIPHLEAKKWGASLIGG